MSKVKVSVEHGRAGKCMDCTWHVQLATITNLETGEKVRSRGCACDTQRVKNIREQITGEGIQVVEWE